MLDALIDKTKAEACRTAEANAIRLKTGVTGLISYDFANNKGFADAIAAIETGSSGSFLHESGTIAIKTAKDTITIPVSDITKSHYFVVVKAKNRWIDVGGVLTEQEGLDFTGATAGQILTSCYVGFYPPVKANTRFSGGADVAGVDLSQLFFQITANNSNQSWGISSNQIEITESGIKISTALYIPFTKYGYWFTFEYDVVGW